MADRLDHTIELMRLHEQLCPTPCHYTLMPKQTQSLPALGKGRTIIQALSQAQWVAIESATPNLVFLSIDDGRQQVAFNETGFLDVYDLLRFNRRNYCWGVWVGDELDVHIL
mmetsp:Transcript_95319/g.188965  ORF Transcript_95319/g.188965 Transcript_95319/m.188965 type:complete len:112 (-) Transcript_95319:640-975(-)